MSEPAANLFGSAVAEALEAIIRKVIREEIQDRPVIQPRLLNAEQAGQYIGRSAQRVRQMHDDGLFPKASSDHRLLFDIHDLDEFIEREKDASQKLPLRAA